MIEGDREAREFWPKVSFTHRKEYVREIQSARGPETKEKRIAAMIDALRNHRRKK